MGVSKEFVDKIAGLQKNTSSLFTDIGYVEVLYIASTFTMKGKRQLGMIHKHTDKKRHTISYARLLLAVQQLVHCYKEMYENNEFNFQVIMKSDEFIFQFGHQAVYEGMYQYGIKIVQDVVLNGDATGLVTNLHNITKILSYFRGEKIVRSLFIYLRLYDHYFNDRLDIADFILKNITKFNNLNVELFNSLIKRIGSEYAEATFANLERDSLKVPVSYKVKSQQEEELGIKTSSSSKGKGEILMQESLHLTKNRYAKDIPRIKDWMLNHFQKLGQLWREKVIVQHPEVTTVPFQLFSIDGILKKGQETILDSGTPGTSNFVPGYLTRYQSYLDEDRKVQSKIKQSNITQSDILGSTDYHALDIAQVPFLKGFMHDKEPSKRYPYPSADNKEQNIVQILTSSTFDDFCKFVEDNDLDNKQDAEDFLSKIIETKKLASSKSISVVRDEDVDTILETTPAGTISAITRPIGPSLDLSDSNNTNVSMLSELSPIEQLTSMTKKKIRTRSQSRGFEE